jgi:cysteinyl-tRNA synthetase
VTGCTRARGCGWMAWMGSGWSGTAACSSYPLELRYALIKVQYRQALNFTLKGLDEARAAIGRVQQCRQRLVRVRDGLERGGAEDVAAAVVAASDGFTAAMSEDLNVSEALAAVFDFVAVVNRAAVSVAGAKAGLAVFARVEDVLGCFGGEPKADATSDAPAELVALLAERKAAKARKDFAAADAIRDRVAAAGWRIVDAAGGARLERG